MQPYSSKIKARAISYRQRGYSINEISTILNIAKSTSSAWLAKIKLNSKSKEILKSKLSKGLKNANKQLLRKKIARQKIDKEIAIQTISSLPKTKAIYQTLCAVMYWCEGQKVGNYHLAFTNSDPQMIATYLKFLRRGFNIDESKFRVNIHLHKYHNDVEQKKYWSKITGIPLRQFAKSYLKPNSEKIIRQNYQGCVRISYYSSEIWHKIEAIYKQVRKL